MSCFSDKFQKKRGTIALVKLSNSYSLAKFVLGWPLALLAIFFLFKIIKSQGGLLIPSVKDINMWFVGLSILCFVTYYFLRSFLWKKILAFLGHDVPFEETTFLWGIAEFKRFVPGNIWSFLGKSASFFEKGVSKKAIAQGLLIEIFVFLTATFLVSVFSLSYIFHNVFPEVFTNIIILPGFFVAAFSVLLLFLFSREFTKRLPHKKTRSFFAFFSPFSFWQNSVLLIITLCYLFFFGMGTYFAIAAIAFLSPVFLLELVAFFVFSLLGGYITIITPMGIGVREAIIAKGLTPLIGLKIAGVGALFARGVLIIAELCFLVLAWILSKSKKTILHKGIAHIVKHKYVYLLAICILIYNVYFTTLSFMRYENFYTGRFDLGNMDQTVWNTMRGRTFQLTDPNGTEIISRLAFHADFMLVLFGPLYKIWSDPRMILLIQTIVLGLGAFFVYLLAKDILKNKRISIIFSVAYLLNPSLEYTNLYDFHSVTMATTFLLAAYYFFRKSKWLLFFLFALLAAITKEEVWLIIALLGLRIFLVPLFLYKRKIYSFKKHYKFFLSGLFMTIICFGIFYLLVFVAIPKARGGEHFALSYYSDFGTSPTKIIHNIIFSPAKTISTAFSPNRLQYYANLFAPLGFLSLLSPPTLVFALPDLVLNILSNNSQLHQIYFHYTATITPFLFIAAMYGIKNIKQFFKKIPLSFFSYYIFLASCITQIFFGPLAGTKNPNVNMLIEPVEDKVAVEGYLSQIKRKYSIAASNNVGSHLSHRQRIYTIPNGIDKADYVIFLLNDPSAQPSLPTQKKMVEHLKHDNRFDLVYQIDDFFVFGKKNLAK